MANQNLTTSLFCVLVEDENEEGAYVKRGKDELSNIKVDIFHKDIKVFQVECSVENGMLETRIYDKLGDLVATQQSDLL